MTKLTYDYRELQYKSAGSSTGGSGGSGGLSTAEVQKLIQAALGAAQYSTPETVATAIEEALKKLPKGVTTEELEQALGTVNATLPFKIVAKRIHRSEFPTQPSNGVPVRILFDQPFTEAPVVICNAEYSDTNRITNILDVTRHAFSFSSNYTGTLVYLHYVAIGN